MKRIKQAIKSMLPQPILNGLQRYKLRMGMAGYRGLSVEDVFSKIYETGAWGSAAENDQPFFSGSGSRDAAVVAPYVAAVKDFLSTMDAKIDAVDLGCGDFFVGAQIRPWCGNYTACDVVPKLIAHNRNKFQALGVGFRVLDLTTGDLPDGDIVFIRQVLQHLSNEQIFRTLPKIISTYKYLVLTEHVPVGDRFVPNLDKPAGPETRLMANSGVVLTAAPFYLRPVGEKVLCTVPQQGGVVVTTLYTLR